MIARSLAAALFAATLSTTALAGEAGAITVTDAWSRATAGPARAAAGFMTVTNTGAQADRLVAAGADFAGRTELHTHLMDGDIMRMREVEGGVPLPPGETIRFKPGGLHVMLMALKEPLREGETRMITLTFEQAGTVAIPFAVGPVGARGPAGHENGHGGH